MISIIRCNNNNNDNSDNVNNGNNSSDDDNIELAGRRAGCPPGCLGRPATRLKRAARGRLG